MPTPTLKIVSQLLRFRGFEQASVPTNAGMMNAWVRSSGSGPPVVLIHGFAAASHHQAGLLRALRKRGKGVIAPDLPGHGHSELPPGGLTSDSLREGIMALLDEVCTEPAVVVGNSLGGVAAVRWALHAPEKVRSLVLLSPGGAPMNQQEINQLRTGFLMNNRRDALRFADRLMGRKKFMKPLVAAFAWRSVRKQPMQAFLESLTPEDLLTAEEVAGLEVPTLLMWGQQDEILPMHQSSFFAEHVPNVVVEEPSDWGHSPYLDDPELLAERIIAFARAC